MLTTLFLAGGVACASARPAVPPEASHASGDGQLLTPDEIERLGARNALDAVHLGMRYLNIQRTKAGAPSRVRYRGVNSLILDPAPLVVIDGARVATFESHLRAIPAETILSIEILSGREGTLKWGADGGNGVIVVMTTPGT